MAILTACINVCPGHYIQKIDYLLRLAVKMAQMHGEFIVNDVDVSEWLAKRAHEIVDEENAGWASINGTPRA